MTIVAANVSAEQAQHIAAAMLESKARRHMGQCLGCMATVVKYSGEIRQALAGQPLPDELASRIRARLCKEGAAILDEILGVEP